MSNQQPISNVPTDTEEVLGPGEVTGHTPVTGDDEIPESPLESFRLPILERVTLADLRAMKPYRPVPGMFYEVRPGVYLRTQEPFISVVEQLDRLDWKTGQQARALALTIQTHAKENEGKSRPAPLDIPPEQQLSNPDSRVYALRGLMERVRVVVEPDVNQQVKTFVDRAGQMAAETVEGFDLQHTITSMLRRLVDDFKSFK